jgi:hypothetical protein
MTIDGISQTSGVERLVDINADAGGLKLTLRDRKSDALLASAIVPAEALMVVLTEQPAGPQLVAANLEVEVRRNEVWLTLGGPDAAVGIDDLMDAVGGAIPGGEA